MSKKIKSVNSKEDLVGMGYKIKINTTTNFGHLYKEIYYWMTHHHYKWHELTYGVIEFPKGGKRLEILWRGIKHADDYSDYVLEVHIAAGISDVKVELENGKTAKLQNGTHEFRIGATIQKNTDVWDGKPFAETQAKLYEMMIRDRLEHQKDELYTEAHKFIDHMKMLLKYYPETDK